jgi:hypothetical protein
MTSTSNIFQQFSCVVGGSLLSLIFYLCVLIIHKLLEGFFDVILCDQFHNLKKHACLLQEANAPISIVYMLIDFLFLSYC